MVKLRFYFIKSFCKILTCKIFIILCLNYARSICTICTHRIQWSCEGLTSTSQQIHWIELNHLLPLTMYNLSLPKLSAAYYGLPMTVQLQTAHEPMLTVWCLVGDWFQVVNCTWLIVYSLDWTVHFGTIQSSLCRGTDGELGSWLCFILMDTQFKFSPTLLQWGSLGQPVGMYRGNPTLGVSGLSMVW